MAYKCRNALGLSSGDECSNCFHLFVPQGDRDLGGGHTKYHTIGTVDSETASLISYKMSLEGWRVSHRRMSLEEVGTGMLGVDRQHARTREVEPGTDPGIFGGEREGRVRRAESRGGLRLGKPDVAAATLRGVEAEWAGSDEALPGEDDRAGAGADHTHGDVVPERRGGEAEALSTEPVCAAVHAGGYRAASGGGCGPRGTERAGDEEDSATGVLRFPRVGVRAAGGAVGGATVPTATERHVPKTRDGVSGNATDEGGDRGAASAGTGRAARVSAGGHGPSGGSGRSERGIPHQRRGRGDAMGGIGSHRTDQRSLSAASAAGHIGAIPL